MAKRYDVLLRLLVVGDTGVGKTCLLCRYVNDEFHDTHISTIGIDFKVKIVKIEGQAVKLQIWDTAGQERFEAITKQFYRRAQGVMLVYDICSRSSFESLPKWLQYVRQFSHDDVVVVLLGNKSDQGQRRQVSSQEAQQFAEKNNMLVFETSAKMKDNLDKPFKEMCRMILDAKAIKARQQQEARASDSCSSSTPDSDTTQLLEEDGAGKKWGCCSIL